LNTDLRLERENIWSALSPDIAGKLHEVILRPGRAMEISWWWSAAQPSGQVKGDF
jgi:hypothetical protein